MKRPPGAAAAGSIRPRRTQASQRPQHNCARQEPCSAHNDGCSTQPMAQHIHMEASSLLAAMPLPAVCIVWQQLGPFARSSLRATCRQMRDIVDYHIQSVTAVISSPANDMHWAVQPVSSQAFSAAVPMAQPTHVGAAAVCSLTPQLDAATIAAVREYLCVGVASCSRGVLSQQGNTVTETASSPHSQLEDDSSTPGPALNCPAPSSSISIWFTLPHLISRLQNLRQLRITLTPGAHIGSVTSVLSQLGRVCGTRLQHLHLDIRCAELTPMLLAAVSKGFPALTTLKLFGLGSSQLFSALQIQPLPALTPPGNTRLATHHTSCHTLRGTTLFNAPGSTWGAAGGSAASTSSSSKLLTSHSRSLSLPNHSGQQTPTSSDSTCSSPNDHCAGGTGFDQSSHNGESSKKGGQPEATIGDNGTCSGGKLDGGSWRAALATLPSGLQVLHLGSIDQDGRGRRWFIQDHEHCGLSHLTTLRELQLTGVAASSKPGGMGQTELGADLSALQPLLSSGSLTHLTVGAVPAGSLSLTSLTLPPGPLTLPTGTITPPSGTLTLPSSSLTFPTSFTAVGSCHPSTCAVASHCNSHAYEAGRCSAVCTSTSQPQPEAPSTARCQSSTPSSNCKRFLGAVMPAKELRAVHAAGWHNQPFWNAISTLWLKGVDENFGLSDIALLGTLPSLTHLNLNCSLPDRGNLADLPAGSLTCLKELKLWWSKSTDLQPGDIGRLLGSGVLSPTCKLVLTSGPCMTRSADLMRLAADCQALATHTGSWSTQLASRQVLTEFQGLILFCECDLTNEGLSAALAPVLPVLEGLVISAPSPQMAQQLLSAEWLSTQAPSLRMLGAQCNDWQMLQALADAVASQIPSEGGSRLQRVEARVWGSDLLTALSGPTPLTHSIVHLMQTAPGLRLRVCAEEAGLQAINSVRAVMTALLLQHQVDPDQMQLLAW